MGPGEVLGEVPLLDGGRHSATARASEPTSLLSLSRADFAALVSGLHPTAFALKRRIAGVACARLRQQLAGLAASLGGGAATEVAAAAPADLEFCGAAEQRVRPALRHVPRIRFTRALGLPDGRPLRPLPGRPHARRRGVALSGVLPDDQRRGREGDRAGRPSHPRRAGRPRAGVRVREPDRRRAVPGHRSHAGADAAPGAAAGGVRAALQRRDEHLARVPRRDPPRPHGGAAAGAPPARPPAPRATSRRCAAAGPPAPR